MTAPLLELHQLGFAWPGQAELLDIPSFTLARNQSLFLKGPSGSGKTTLLGLIGGVQKAQRGTVQLLGTDLAALSAGALGSGTAALHRPRQACSSIWGCRRACLSDVPKRCRSASNSASPRRVR